MGNFFSRKQSRSNQSEINELRDRLSDLENLDKNKDGIITKDELQGWMNEQKKDLDSFRKKIEQTTEAKYHEALIKSERDLNDAQQSMKDLKKELKSLKKINSKLEQELKQKYDEDIELTQSKTANGMTVKDLTRISKSQINKFVDELLDDEDVNSKYIPDFVERQLYRNIFKILLGTLDNLFDSTSVKFMGHQITFDLQPDDEIDYDSDGSS